MDHENLQHYITWDCDISGDKAEDRMRQVSQSDLAVTQLTDHFAGCNLVTTVGKKIVRMLETFAMSSL